MDRLVTMSLPGAGGGHYSKIQIYSRLSTVILNVRLLLAPA